MKMYKNQVGFIFSNHSAGSGFVMLKTNYIVTCAHVTLKECDISYSVATLEGSTRPPFKDLKIIKIDTDYDIALLESPVRISDTVTTPDFIFDVKVADHLFYMGFDTASSRDRTLAFKVNSAFVSKADSMKINKKNVRYFEFEGIALHGYSGGPVFNDKGQVIGLIKGMYKKNGKVINRAYSIIPILKGIPHLYAKRKAA